jgi:FtsH-binding integral membrane protein
MASLFERRNHMNMRSMLDFSHLEPMVQKHLQNVYVSMCVCTLAAAVGGWVHLNSTFLQGGILSGLGAIGCLIAMMCKQHSAKNLPMRFGFLTGFAFLMGLTLGPLLDMAAHVAPHLIPTAFLLTSAIFVSLSLCATLTKRREFLYLGGALFSALSIMALLRLVNIFVRSEALFDLNLYGGLLVFCGFVLFDTQLIIEKRRNGDDDFVWHAVDLFIDALDIFVRILIILTKKEKKRE